MNFVLPIIVRLEERLDHFLDSADFSFESVDDGLDAFSGGFGVGAVPAIGLLSFEVDELPPAHDELLDFDLFFRSFVAGDWLHFFCEESQDAGIDAVGLGHQAQGLGEIAGSLGIDDRDAVTGIGEVGDDLAFKAPGSFEDNETSGRAGEEFFQLFMSCFGVGQRLGLPSRKNVEIECGLGHVNSDRNLVRAIHGDIPFLPMRARAAIRPATAPATVRACFQRPAAIQLCDGVLST